MTTDTLATHSHSFADVVVIIPALNEAAAIGQVLSELPPVAMVLVVDNGSSDHTAAVARRAGARVVTEPQRGYGAACLAGLAAIRQLCPPPQIVVFLDADYSDYPDQLPRLVEPILAGEYDFVLGSRMAGDQQRGAMPPQSRYGNRLACWLMRQCFAATYSDLGPFRAIRWDALEQLNMRDRDFGWTIEMQIKARQAELRCLEVPVSYRCRIGRSKISGTLSGTLRAGSKILFTIAKYRWQLGLRGTRTNRVP